MPEMFNRDELWMHGKFTGIMAAIAGVVFIIVPYIFPQKAAVVIQGLALLLLVGAGSQAFSYGSTLISMRLQGEQRRRFQIAVSLAVPTVLTLYFVSRAEGFDPERVGLSKVWVLLPLALIAWLCWVGGESMDREHPFRGFLIVAAILFVWCFLKEQGMYFESDDYDPEGGSTAFIDKQRAKFARETGEYAMRYPLYVGTAYAALLARMKKRKRDERIQ
jgi:hypothetical protein